MRRVAFALAACILAGSAAAQTSPNLTYGQVPTAGQWNGWFAGKQDLLPYRPLNPAGGTMTGRLTTAPSTINGAGLNVPPGIAPSAPASGDVWTTSAGLFVNVNGATQGPLASGSAFLSIKNALSELATAGSQAAARANIGAAASGANADITSLASPALGSATATTQPTGTGNTTVATTAFATQAVAAEAALARNASNLTSGTVPPAQLPVLTGDVATSTGSIVTTIQPSTVTNAKMANAPAGTVKANTGGSAAAPSDVTPSSLLDASFGATQGGLLYRGASAWTLLGPGSSGQVLGTGGAGANPAWQNAGGNGTVTSVAVAVPSDETVSGSPVTSSGTITISRNAQAANAVFAGPASGTAAAPTYRSLGTADLPMTALAYGGLKNRLFNGAMAVDQRNSGAAVTLGTATLYTVDRWFGWTGASPASETAQRVAVLSGGVAYAARLARASGATATATMNLGQVLETVPNVDLQGQTVTLSLKARAGANFSGSGLACKVGTGTGTDQGSSSFASAGWTGYAVAASATFTLTNSFQTFAFQAPIPTGATEIGVSCGFTPTGTAGSADNVDLSDVQLEPSAFTAAQVTFERRPLNVETALCQRFFVQWTTLNRADLAAGLAYSTSAAIFPLPLPVPMRVTPAINSSTIAVLNGSGGQVNGGSQAVQAVTDKTVEIAIGGMSGLTVGQASVLTIGTGSGGLLSLNAEL